MKLNKLTAATLSAVLGLTVVGGTALADKVENEGPNNIGLFDNGPLPDGDGSGNNSDQLPLEKSTPKGKDGLVLDENGAPNQTPNNGALPRETRPTSPRSGSEYVGDNSNPANPFGQQASAVKTLPKTSAVK